MRLAISSLFISSTVMELLYSSSSSLCVPRLQPVTPTRKSSNLTTICAPITSPSAGYYSSTGGRSDSQFISAKLSFIRASSKTESEAVISKEDINLGVACWRFLRPYVIKGIVIASTSLFARALIENPSSIEWSLVLKALSGIFALVCAQGFTAGINQIYDVEIDKINKPYLPIAAGDLSIESAWMLVAFYAAAGFSVVGFSCGPLLTCLYGLSLFLGMAYSVPPFRLKTIPLATILYISTVYGFLHNFGVYYSLRATFGLPFQWSAPLVFITTFATLTLGVTAIIKDLSDVEGDSKSGIETLATKLGLRNVAYLGCGLMLFYYAASILAAIYMPQVLRRNLIIPLHLILALSLIYQTRVLDQASYSTEASLKFYMVIWNLYYAEYLIFPFI